MRDGSEIGDGEDVGGEEGYEDYGAKEGCHAEDDEEDLELALLEGLEGCHFDSFVVMLFNDCLEEWKCLKKGEESEVFSGWEEVVFQACGAVGRLTLPSINVGKSVRETRGISAAISLTISLVCKAVPSGSSRSRRKRTGKSGMLRNLEEERTAATQPMFGSHI